MSRVGIAALWLVALTVVTESWEAPFGFRHGDYPARGIDSRIEFERVDEIASESRRRDAEDGVPLVFRHDPAAISQLPDRFRADLGEVSAATTVDDVSDSTRDAFGFGADVPAAAADARFSELRSAVEDAGPLSTDDRIKDILSEFRNFLTPLMTSGVISPTDIARLQLDRGTQLRVVPKSEDEEVAKLVEPVLLTKVQLSDQLNDSGELGSKWLSYPHLAPIREGIKDWLKRRLAPTLEYDESATKQARGAARDAVKDVVETFDQGESLVARQTILEEEELALLAAEHEAVSRSVTLLESMARLGLSTLLILLLIVLNLYYLGRVDGRVIQQPSRLAIYATSVVVTVALARALSFDPWRAEVAPILIFSMIYRVAYSQVFATVSAFTLCLLVTLSTTGDVRQFVVLIAASAAAIQLIGRVQTRTTLIRVGFWTGLIYIGVFFAMRAVGDPIPMELLTSSMVIREALLGGAWCLFCGYLVTGSLPFVESMFGVVTDINLLELSDPSHPLLQELVRRAPGTYAHSMAVGSISESAAEAVGGNGLLCRVAAYFHDAGKMLKPEYFIENLGSGETSPHDQLAPAMSKLVIIGHVKDGVDLAEQYNLPSPIIDFIEQHHGTTLVEYFYREASKKAEGRPEARTDAEEESFRYPGPKPQTREAGVMMIVDACESASRAMTDPTPKRLEQLVRDITMKRLLDGQFDECELTLSDLHKIELSIAKSLTAMYHGRIKYPDAKSA